jgi:mono/diheme cytochrome c family protein
MSMKAVLTFLLMIAWISAARLQPQSPAASASDAAVREQGRNIFAAKCGKCHNEDARKILSDGSTLLTRLAASRDSQALLGTRLKTMRAEDRHAVSIYVEGLLSALGSPEKK